MEPVTITTCRDGPLLVRGPVVLQDQEGRELGIRRSTVALCRCGKSRLLPLCDGTHKVTGFRAPSGVAGAGSSPDAAADSGRQHPAAPAQQQ